MILITLIGLLLLTLYVLSYGVRPALFWYLACAIGLADAVTFSPGWWTNALFAAGVFLYDVSDE